MANLSIVSIHAPVKGATGFHVLALVHAEGFNPRSREGSDRQRGMHHVGVFCFNPRSREGSDPRRGPVWAALWRFNPRSREGSDDLSDATLDDLTRVSIHAPVKGATGCLL